MASTLARIDIHPIYDSPNEIRAFLTVRNEVLRLPSTLRHPRERGVHCFMTAWIPRWRAASITMARASAAPTAA